MLKVAVPRPATDAVVNVGSRRPLSNALRRGSRWPVENAFGELVDPPVRALTRAEAEALRRVDPPLSPWRVVAVQAGVGALLAVVIGLAAGSAVAAVSALYGAAVVAVPGALMARGATSRVGLASPIASAATMLSWMAIKMAVSVVMLAIAPRVVPGLVWPAMLAALVICLQTYWFALLWRGRK